MPASIIHTYSFDFKTHLCQVPFFNNRTDCKYNSRESTVYYIHVQRQFTTTVLPEKKTNLDNFNCHRVFQNPTSGNLWLS